MEAAVAAAAAAVLPPPAAPPLLRWADWAAALRHVGASTLRGPLDATPPGAPDGTAWAAVGGAAAAKARLAAAVGWPPTDRRGGGGGATTTAAALRVRGTPRGVLLYGPPGTGKTALVRAAAAAGAVAFLRLDPAAAYSAYLGEAEATVRAAFATARAAAPAVLFLDELDALVGSRDDASGGGSGGGDGPGGGGGGGGGGGSGGGGSGVRRRVLATLLTEMDGISGAPGVVVVGATNRPDLLDAALLRPGRFDDLLPVLPPATDADRVAVLAATAARGGVPLQPGVDLRRVAAATAGRSGAELAALLREAAMVAVREERHFDVAIAAAMPLPPRVGAGGEGGRAGGAAG
ncbi:hypothetical protein I4F81_007246 [Pyropia yezoensis]|uniref:Uncharacterized protein n=1 Tax=Pyropia yezoensis TaxID=2788 RepID=A0ACC3C4G3_PYRYE|nr:hypothetical protein I4F81_007246 [Neopyropia yezoensis]